MDLTVLTSAFDLGDVNTQILAVGAILMGAVVALRAVSFVKAAANK